MIQDGEVTVRELGGDWARDVWDQVAGCIEAGASYRRVAREAGLSDSTVRQFDAWPGGYAPKLTTLRKLDEWLRKEL